MALPVSNTKKASSRQGSGLTLKGARSARIIGKLKCLKSYIFFNGACRPRTVVVQNTPVIVQQPPVPPTNPILNPNLPSNRGAFSAFNCGNRTRNNNFNQCRTCVTNCNTRFNDNCRVRGSQCFLCRDNCVGRFGVLARGRRNRNALNPTVPVNAPAPAVPAPPPALVGPVGPGGVGGPILGGPVVVGPGLGGGVLNGPGGIVG